jgi:hypothetical protein
VWDLEAFHEAAQNPFSSFCLHKMSEHQKYKQINKTQKNEREDK